MNVSIPGRQAFSSIVFDSVEFQVESFNVRSDNWLRTVGRPTGMYSFLSVNLVVCNSSYIFPSSDTRAAIAALTSPEIVKDVEN